MDILKMNPGELAEYRYVLSDNFAKAGELKVKLMRAFALFYQIYRENYKSDAGLQRAFDLTEDGLKLMEIREKMKSIEHKLSSIRTLLETRKIEVQNQW